MSSAAILPADHNNTSPVAQLLRSTGRADVLLSNRLILILPLDLRPPILYQPYQSGQSQRIYQHAKEKGIYQIDDDPASKIDKEDLDAENFYFTNKGYKEL